MTSSVKTAASDSIAPPSVAPASQTRVDAVSDRFVLVGDYFPILLSVSPAQYTENTVRQMAEAFEEYFIRGTRYVVISVSPNGARPPDAKQRKLVTDWISSPRVMSYSARLCLGSANIVPSSLLRGLHTALLWAWSPPFPVKPVAGAREALDYALDTLEKSGVPLPPGGVALRVKVQRRLQEIMG
ncbi:MAG TPA: hypothetical protein VI197_20565 [Polyangiaceae bacterium]